MIMPRSRTPLRETTQPMTPQGRLERLEPSSSQSTASEGHASRWRTAIAELLTSEWSVCVNEAEFLTHTIVGMFDAGASDSEVAAFLRTGAPHTSDRSTSALADLAGRMHRSAGHGGRRRVVYHGVAAAGA